ncbi:hypothetical protein [Pseudooceanicola sp. LIPI14-2-Ac024]|uniref:hypothetical protein n=1 Tax=Pseudooceanicola sp. LIPI14-2-Ac024 TaxID=3344875 RepID=UPI0035CF0787
MSEEYLSTPADASYYPITILEVLVQPGWTIPGKQRLARYRRADGTESGLIFPHACQVQRVLITPGQVLDRRTQFMEVRRLDDVATAEPKAAPAAPSDPTPGAEAAAETTAAPPPNPRRSAMRWLIGVPLALVVLLWALEAARIWPWHPTWYALKQAITGHPDFEGYYDWASEYYGTETSRDATAQAPAAAPTKAPAPQDTAQTDVARIMATMSDEMIWEADAVCDDDTPGYFGYQLLMDYGLTSEDEIDAFCSAVWDAALALVRENGTTQGTAPALQTSAQTATPRRCRTFPS